MPEIIYLVALLVSCAIGAAVIRRQEIKRLRERRKRRLPRE